ALLTAMASAADVTFKEVVREACLSRDHFMAWTDEAGNAGAAAAQMASVLGVDASDRIEDVEAEILDGPFLPRSRWDDIAFALEDGSASDNTQGQRLRAAKAFYGSDQVDDYLSVFLTDDKMPRKAVVTRKFCEHNPSVARLF